jgi:hypothetical protein
VLWLAARGVVLLVAETGNNALQIHCAIGTCRVVWEEDLWMD